MQPKRNARTLVALVRFPVAREARFTVLDFRDLMKGIFQNLLLIGLISSICYTILNIRSV